MTGGRLWRVGRVRRDPDQGLLLVFDGGCGAAADAPRCPGCPGARGAHAVSLRALGVVAAPDDSLALSVRAAGLGRAAAVVFGLPLALLITGAWLGGAAGGEPYGEVWSMVAGLAGLVLGWWLLRRLAARLLAALDARARPAAEAAETFPPHRRLDLMREV